MKKFEVVLGQKPMIFETGRMAKQADGAVVASLGGTTVLVAVCGSREPKEGADFFPLTCDYREMAYAGGKIPGGYFKREGKATEKEVLSGRLMDRPIRPLFPEGFYYEVQVTATVLASDKEHNADILAMNAASAALMISGIPYLGPMAAARVGDVDGQFILNPTYLDLEKSPLDIIVATTELGIIMIEAGAKIVSEERVIQALEFATEALKPVLKLQRDMQKHSGKTQWTPVLQTLPVAFMDKVRKQALSGIDAINSKERSKEGRENALSELAKKIEAEFVVEGGEITADMCDQAFHDVEKESVREFILSQKMRTDGRKYDEIRAITCEIGVLPRTHGSALFTRGQTQSLGVATLGTSRDEQIIDAIEGDIFKNFMFHYNFPSYSVGEIKPNRGPGRREIGHGALAERGLRPVMPSKDEFPYTIRLVSEILESNGSSSMASVCSGTLALMEAGVPVKAPVSGIAMGLVKEKDRVAVLSDIAGVEDHLGDMDFKVTGTAQGITALQLDLKLKESLGIETLRKALGQAKEGRLFILKKMTDLISAPKPEISEFAPRITTIKVDPEKIREIIGPGGKMIRKIQAESGAEIEVEDDGTVRVAASDNTATQKAIDIIKGITEDPEVGKVYDCTVKRVMNFGAFCEILPGKEGLVHISELADGYVESVESVVKIGDQFKVKVIEIDQMGRINLSKKQSTHDGPPVPMKRAERGDRGPRDRDRGPRGDRGFRGDRDRGPSQNIPQEKSRD
ncbi:MAG: polyribonucleotide nucleotidyltransferase [Omnitrophica bacterium RIFCSPHIGHO2_02_FULL_63_14]|nr:MAG: polyribonucleotide nucleotidyltransferase [Omnitrophica bacterium RIFCSPHIGHO2_02_FULL_63_14]